MLVRGKFFWGNDAGGREDWAPGACQRYDNGSYMKSENYTLHYIASYSCLLQYITTVFSTLRLIV